jgi:outer membrane protein OmpA-like peptidoglycan-associated protein
VDLTGRQDVEAEEIIAGLTPVRTRGLKTRGLQPGLATIALTVNFAFDSAEIQPQAVPNLQSLGKALQSPQLAPYRIRIEGHTDNIGTEDYNRHLSQRRAESVKQYLTQHFDIASDHLDTEGKGEEEPISENSSDTGRYKNRRAEFVNLGRR